jgi:hypothetical protein
MPVLPDAPATAGPEESASGTLERGTEQAAGPGEHTRRSKVSRQMAIRLRKSERGT